MKKNVQKLEQGEFLLRHLQSYLKDRYKEILSGEARLRKAFDERKYEYELGFIQSSDFWLQEVEDLSNWFDEFRFIEGIEAKDDYVLISIGCMWECLINMLLRILLQSFG